MKLCIYNEKSGRKIGTLTIQKICGYISTCEGKYDGVPLEFRTLMLMHLKEIGLFCNIFFRSWCIHLIRSIHRNKSAQRNSRKCHIFYLAYLRQIRWSTLNFPHVFFLFYNLECLWKAFSIICSCQGFIPIFRIQQGKSEIWKPNKFVLFY